MKIVFFSLLAACFCLSQAQANNLPPMMFYSSIPGDTMLLELKKTPEFAGLDKELIGSPVALRITMSRQATNGGAAAGLTSAILAGSTLGLLPIVENKDLTITYEILVHGEPITSHSYTENFTDAINLYSMKGFNELPDNAMTWVKGTIPQFVSECSKDPKVTALSDEYRYYFQ